MAYDFETFMSRHGEIGTQAILEAMERREGIRASASMALADRWAMIMGASNQQPTWQARAAA